MPRSPRSIRLFIKSYCGWCHEAMDWLEKQGIDYQLLDVLSDPSAMQEMIGLSGQTRTPTIEVNGQVLADFGVDELETFWSRLPEHR